MSRKRWPFSRGHAAVFLEPLERVVVEHFAPEVGVVAGRIAAAPDVREVAACDSAAALRARRPCTSSAPRSRTVSTSCSGASAGSVCQAMSSSAAARYSVVAKPWLNVLRLLDLVDQRLRHRLAGLVVLGVVGEHLRVERPVLVELRRELDEVARRVGAGERRILHVREHAVQRVAELVEHRGHVVEAEQRRLAGGRLGEVRRRCRPPAWCRVRPSTGRRSCPSTRRRPCCRA